jgi:hypothetical protein
MVRLRFRIIVSVPLQNRLMKYPMLNRIGLLVAVLPPGTLVKSLAHKATCIRLPLMRLFTGPSLMLHAKPGQISIRAQIPYSWDAARQTHVVRAAPGTILRQLPWVQIISKAHMVR